MSFASRVWVDGEWRAGGELEGGVSRGEGLFETLGVFGGRLPLWERHLARLTASARAFGHDGAMPDGLRAAANELLANAPRDHEVLRITLDFARVGGGAPRWSLTSRARSTPRAGERDVRVWVATTRREGVDATVAHKTTSREFWRRLASEAASAAQGVAFDDVLVLGGDDSALETATGNVFCALDGQLCTPPADCRILPGVARALLLETCAVRIVERRISLAELVSADAVWVSNAVHGPRRASLVGGDPRRDHDLRRTNSLGASLDAAWRAATAT